MPEKDLHLSVQPCPYDDTQKLEPERKIEIHFPDKNLAEAYVRGHKHNGRYTYGGKEHSETVYITLPHGLKQIKTSPRGNFVFVFDHEEQAKKWLQEEKTLTYRSHEEPVQPREVQIQRKWTEEEVRRQIGMSPNTPKNKNASSTSSSSTSSSSTSSSSTSS
jgi:hypothetical protein